LFFFNQETRTFSNIRPYDFGPTGGYIGDQEYDPAAANPAYSFFRLYQVDSTNNFGSPNYVGIVSSRDINTDTLISDEKGILEINRLFLYGTRTVPSDLPTSGASRFRPVVGSSLRLTIDVDINWTNGEIAGVARVPCLANELCPTGDLGEIRLTGRFDGNIAFRGAVSGSAGYTGSFIGSFYGPRASEMGIVGTLRHRTRGDDAYIWTVGGFNISP
jgi:hypothetical protein